MLGDYTAADCPVWTLRICGGIADSFGRCILCGGSITASTGVCGRFVDARAAVESFKRARGLGGTAVQEKERP